MLSTAIFKEVFPIFQVREPNYYCCPSVENSKKKIVKFWRYSISATYIFSGSNYPTLNLFSNNVYQVKVVLDKK